MATTINFTVGGLREKVLNKLATANNKTPEEYIIDRLNIHLEEQVRGYYKNIFNNMDTIDIYNLFGDIT